MNFAIGKTSINLINSVNLGAGQIFNLPRTDDFSRRGKVPSHLTAKVVSTVAFQNKIKNLSCTRKLHKPYKLYKLKK